MKTMLMVLVAGCAVATAKIGESEEEIQKRYGKPLAAQTNGAGVFKMFKTEGFTVTVHFIHSQSAMETVERKQPLSDDECVAMAKGIGGDGDWRKRPQPTDDLLATDWSRVGSGISARRTKRLFKDDMLVVAHDSALRALEQSKEREAAQAANVFGKELNPKPPVSEEERRANTAIQEQIAAAERDRQHAFAQRQIEARQKSAAEMKARTVKYQLEQAEKGLPSFQYEVGTRYLRGDGVEKDEAKARVWFEKSAAQGESLAVKALADMKK